MKTQRECLYETIHNNDKPLKVVAEEIGMSESYLTRAALPDQEDSETGSGCRFPLKKLVPLIRSTQDFSVLDNIELSLGRVAIRMPAADGGSLKDVVHLAMTSVVEFGELMSSLNSGLADGRLSEEEISKIEKEGYDAMQAIVSLTKQVRGTRDARS